ncbi:MAG TPA: helix-turn-helix domain-containing protein [Anaerolineales bacterium]|nr:helix-turn-helix domain-containing protein [Anaerolineales bacterium]
MIQAKDELTFGGWLRKRRRELDLTQQVLADRAGCTRITLRRIEAGTLKPSGHLAETLLKLLGIPSQERKAWVQFARGIADHPTFAQFLLRTNLPSLLTSFVGRKKEISEVKDALFHHRLVTLTGSGGIGKSRLSLQVAADLLTDFLDGVWFIELASLSDPNLLPQTIQNILGLIEQKNTSPLQTLQEYLKEKKILLVLDNCEHLVEACATVAHTLLSHTTSLKILASSREALGVQGEFAWRVPSLSVPDTDKGVEADQLSRYEAVKLFIERARLIDPQFVLDETNASFVARICSRLDGIPLAIELAAARLKTLTVEQIHARLDDRFSLLTNGARTLPSRHQTLRAAIEWSYTSLSENEKTLFRRLAVFTGGWSLEAAETICSGNGIKQEDVLDLITSLLQKSLIHTSEFRPGVRYEQLETIRQYGQEKFLASDEVEILRNRHLQYFVELAKRAEPELRSSAQVQWFTLLEQEISNLRSAMQWAKETDKTAFLQLTSSLWLFFRSLEHKDEGIDCLLKAVSVNKDTPTPLLSTAMARLASLSIYLSIVQDQTEDYALTALDLSRQVRDKPAEALALISLAGLELERMTGKFGPEYTELALGIARDLKDSWLISTALIQKGRFTQIKNPIESVAIFEEALKEAQASGDKRLLYSNLFWMFINILATGQLARAKEIAHQCVLVATEIGDKDGIMYSHNALAGIGLFEEDYESSKEHAETIIRLSKAYQHNSGLLNGLGTAGLVNLATKNISQVLELSTEMDRLILSKSGRLKSDTGYSVFLRIWAYILERDLKNARSNARELIPLYTQNDNILLSIEYFRVFAALAYMDGCHEINITLTSFAKKLHERVALAYFDYPFMSRLRAEQLAQSREALGADAFNQAWEKGQQLDLEEAKKYTLEIANR